MGNGTHIGTVRGHGSAHHGSQHWLMQRFTAISNLLLSLWLVTSFVLLPNFSYGSVHDWIVRPVPALALTLLLVSVFWHMRLGLQVVIEDYVHTTANRFGCMAILNLLTIGGAASGLFFIAEILMADVSGGIVKSAIQAAQGAR